uniref:Uncharacterized protein n=1 Tax=Picea sitchensis TaxID=3332 RepID=A9NR00_PICSI|nr:unknown [Picea sitchensis]
MHRLQMPHPLPRLSYFQVALLIWGTEMATYLQVLHPISNSRLSSIRRTLFSGTREVSLLERYIYHEEWRSQVEESPIQ